MSSNKKTDMTLPPPGRIVYLGIKSSVFEKEISKLLTWTSVNVLVKQNAVS